MATLARLRAMGAVEASVDGVSAKWGAPPAPAQVTEPAASPEELACRESLEHYENLLHSVPGGEAFAAELAHKETRQ